MGLTAQTLAKHPPNSVAMVKGHMDQTRQNKNSTKVKTAITPSLPTDDDDAFRPATHLTFARITVSQPSSNLVLDRSTPTKRADLFRTGPCILAGYQVLHARLVAAGLRPQLQRLDNECSTALKQFMSAEDVDYQLVPPNLHRRNAAERAIRTFKNHFIAGLCGVDKNFPLHLWDKLLPQAEITLNLLRGSRINPKLSAHAQMHGAFDFNRTPLAPPGIRVLVHIKPNERTTWSPHGEDGWYVGPALDSYRCYTVWMWDTRATRVCDTLAWFPTKCPMPLASSTDLILAGIRDILHALRNPTPGSPLAPLTDSHYDALTQLTSILTSIAAPTRTLTNAPPTSPVTEPDLLEDVAVTDPPLRVVTNNPGPTSTPIPAIPLRVGNLPAIPAAAELPTLDTRTPQHCTCRAPTNVGPTPSTALVHKENNDSNTSPPSLWPTSSRTPTKRVIRPCHTTSLCMAMPSTRTPARSQNIANSANAATEPSGGHQRRRIGRLAQGYGAVKGTNTMHFIPVSAIPRGRKATYLRVVSAFRPEKENPRRVRWTCGGDKVDYPFDVSTKTADLTTAKLLINSVLSTKNAKFLTADLKDFYLGTPMERYEYMRIPIHMIPDVIIDQYNLRPLIHNGHVYVEIRRGILVVDDFGIRYTDIADAEHLLATLEATYQVSRDWSGARYCGLTLTGIIPRARATSVCLATSTALLSVSNTPYHANLNIPAPMATSELRRQNTVCGSRHHCCPRRQRQTPHSRSAGYPLFYARAIDSTLLTAIGELATEHSQSTTYTMEKLAQLLNYCATHPDASVRFFTASDMILAVESDASYLSVAKGRSRAAGYFT
ncbi:hypothetical protein MHU86_18012 [Fragilaria crotonensis]|nr:hypothetical protein MHU86_18012 [Fragilaria crotonensis]